MKIQLASTLLLFYLIFIFTGCEKDELDSSDTYIFIEQHSEEFGELVLGPQPPLLMIDFPTYTYDFKTKTLNGIIDFGINKDLKLIYGSGTCLSGTAGGGCGTGLSGIYEIPYERGNFELLKADADGRVVAIYNDEVIDLNAGEEWILEVVRFDTTSVNGQTSISRITQTDKITNYGILEKSDIIEWSWE